MSMLYTEVRWSNMALPSAPQTETKNKLCGWYWKVQLWAFLPWVASDSTFAGSFALSDLAIDLCNATLYTEIACTGSLNWLAQVCFSSWSRLNVEICTLLGVGHKFVHSWSRRSLQICIHPCHEEMPLNCDSLCDIATTNILGGS